MCPKQEPRVDPGECTLVGVGWAGVGWGVWIVPESTLLSKSSDMACVLGNQMLVRHRLCQGSKQELGPVRLW